MALISPAQVTDGTTMDAVDINGPINTIANEINGNLDNSNIKASAAIDASKIVNITTVRVSNPYKFSVYRTAAFSAGTNAFLKVIFDTKLFDTGNNFDVTLGRFVAPVSGFYSFHGSANHSLAASSVAVIGLYKNGAQEIQGNQLLNGNALANHQGVVTGLLQLVAGDYIEMHVYGSGGAGSLGKAATFLHGFLVSIS